LVTNVEAYQTRKLLATSMHAGARILIGRKPEEKFVPVFQL
jgi:hypothetical protein